MWAVGPCCRGKIEQQDTAPLLVLFCLVIVGDCLVVFESFPAYSEETKQPGSFLICSYKQDVTYICLHLYCFFVPRGQ